ncbi:type II secretion system protein [bacterium]|nr:type II secretion system protein [bacterium]
MVNLVKKRAITLLEVVLATLILIIVLGPFLRNLISQAKTGEDTEKLQMATKILQSSKEELMAVRFKDFVAFADKSTPNENKEFTLDDMFYPTAKEEVLKFQKKYRDFEVSGTFKFVERKNRDPKERSTIFFRIEVTWFQPNAGTQKRSTSMTIIDPKS